VSIEALARVATARSKQARNQRRVPIVAVVDVRHRTDRLDGCDRRTTEERKARAAVSVRLAVRLVDSRAIEVVVLLDEVRRHGGEWIADKTRGSRRQRAAHGKGIDHGLELAAERGNDVSRDAVERCDDDDCVTCVAERHR